MQVAKGTGKAALHHAASGECEWKQRNIPALLAEWPNSELRRHQVLTGRQKAKPRGRFVRHRGGFLPTSTRRCRSIRQPYSPASTRRSGKLRLRRTRPQRQPRGASAGGWTNRQAVRTRGRVFDTRDSVKEADLQSPATLRAQP